MARLPITDSLPAEEWAGVMGDRWLAHLNQFEGMIAPVGQALITRAAFRSGERIVDIGCGAGGTSIDIARQVGPQGAVLGIDISPQLVAAAQRRAQAANVNSLTFRCTDAAIASIEGPRFDRLFSRFGVMFFPDAYVAFANLHTLLRVTGRLDFCVWAPARDNAWVAQMMGIVGQYVELPAPVPRAPGPFALDDPNYVRELLGHGGFKDVRIEMWQGNQLVAGPGASPREATDFVLNAMSFGRLLEESASDVLIKVQAELTALFTRHQNTEGVQMSAKAYLVSATA